MVLAAGFGKRMLPLTRSIPKPMVKVDGQTLIDRVLDRIAQAGITRAIVNAHYCGDVLIEHLSTRKTPLIEISDERDALLDTGGGVVRALPKLGSKPFLLVNSDTIWIEGASPNLLAACCGVLRRVGAWMRCCCSHPTAGAVGYGGAGRFRDWIRRDYS
jgi:MurNAc alpha-1-phosphate uridylyltransferase